MCVGHYFPLFDAEQDNGGVRVHAVAPVIPTKVAPTQPGSLCPLPGVHCVLKAIVAINTFVPVVAGVEAASRLCRVGALCCGPSPIP